MNTMVMNNAPSDDIFTKVEAGEAKLTDEFWVKTLTQIKELNDKGYFQQDALGTKDPAAGALFIQEKAAMLASGSYQLAQNKQQNPNLEQKLLAPITVSADQAKYEGVHTTTFMLAVNSKSKHPEEAKKFLEFLSNPDVASDYANQTGQNVTVNDVKYDTPELQVAGEWATKKTVFQPRFTILNGDNQKAVTNSIQAVLSGTSPEEAAQQAQAIIDQHIGK